MNQNIIKSSISETAKKVIERYSSLLLPIPVKCPYYNNRRGKIRGGLRALIGKGTPEEIVEEALLLALRKKISFKELNAEMMTKFLVDHFLGVDCSGFVYHVLDAEFKAKTGHHLRTHLTLAKDKNFLRKIFAKLRPAENANVREFAKDINSALVQITDVSAGDIITMTHNNPDDRAYDHILLITSVETVPSGTIPSSSSTSQNILKIKYSHSIAWPEDGKYNHGISGGIITVTDPSSPLPSALWEEKDVPESQNRTKSRALACSKCEIRRIK
ncbi:MAG: hypothetical protein NTV72_01165 [Candidatus Taylorbacteria bacterium]|nr:hypothetical protein [Candidatus Taylorbacteria bacterium]